MKCRVSFEQLDVGNKLSKWKMLDIEACLNHDALNHIWIKPCNNSILLDIH